MPPAQEREEKSGVGGGKSGSPGRCRNITRLPPPRRCKSLRCQVWGPPSCTLRVLPKLQSSTRQPAGIRRLTCSLLKTADGAVALQSSGRPRRSCGAAPAFPYGVRGDAAEPPDQRPARDASTRGRAVGHPRWGCSRRAPGPPTARGGSGMPRAKEPPSGRQRARGLPSPPELASCVVPKTKRARRPPLAEHRPLQELDATDSARCWRNTEPETASFPSGAPDGCSG